MRTIGLSPLEIRGIVERAFLPLECTCEQAPEGCFTISIEDPHGGTARLVAEGISADRFASSREISNLIAELRTKVETRPAVTQPTFQPQFQRGRARA